MATSSLVMFLLVLTFVIGVRLCARTARYDGKFRTINNSPTHANAQLGGEDGQACHSHSEAKILRQKTDLQMGKDGLMVLSIANGCLRSCSAFLALLQGYSTLIFVHAVLRQRRSAVRGWCSCRTAADGQLRGRSQS